MKPTRGPEKGEGQALFHSSGNFKGNCRNCGEYRHKAAYCKKKDKTEEKSTSRSKENSEKDVKCSYCHQKGHTVDVCRIKQRVEAKKKGNEATLKVLMAAEQSDNKGHLWIGDSGASSHMTNSNEGLYDVEESDQVIIVGNGEKLKAIKIGKLKMKTKDLNGNEVFFILNDVKYVPGLWKNLFSVGKALKEGAKLESLGKNMVITKGTLKIEFKELTENGLMGITLTPITVEALATFEKKEDINKFHCKLGHPSKEITIATAKNLRVKLDGSWEECEECMLGKARKKNLKSNSMNKSTKAGERFGFDISYIKNDSFGGSKYWLLIVDEFSSMVWSYFLRRKTESTRKMVEFIEITKAKDSNMAKYLCCDNSPENKGILKELQKKGLETQFKFTAPGTPEENGKVKRMFTTLWGRSRAMINQANLDEEFRTGLWTECANCATQTNNILVRKNKTMMPYKEFYGKEASYTKSLRNFGEMCIRTVRKGHQDKLENRGDMCIFVGYPDNH
jgi:hypothetical protein